MNLLFVCSENRLSSPTAAAVFERYANVETRSAGVGPFAGTPVSPDLLEWADVILVMEEEQQVSLLDKYPDVLTGKRVVCLDIPDQFAYMDPELVRLLETRVPEQVSLPEGH
jgi:predicted protein tyrosine phosphatase